LKKFLATVLSAALLLTCCACGQSSLGSFRALETIGTKHYGVICRKNDKLAPIINAALNYLAASGTLSNISEQWLGKDAITIAGDGTLLGELEYDGMERTLIVGVPENFNPMSFEQNGRYAGMTVDIGNYMGYLLNWPVIIQPIGVTEVGAQLSSGNIDCALGFDIGSVRTEKYDVGVSYMDSDIILAVRSDSDVKNIKALKGQRIGIVEDPTIKTAVKSNEQITKYSSGATEYLSVALCLDALDNGWCAAVALDELHLIYPN